MGLGFYLLILINFAIPVCLKLLAIIDLFWTRVWYLIYLLSIFYRVEVDTDPTAGRDEVMFCCGQLVAKGFSQQHLLCNGEEDKLTTGRLLLELEKCPHSGCGARFPMAPVRNLEHQDTMHHAILSYICATCRACFVSEGVLLCHVIKDCGGPRGFEIDMNRRHGEHYCVKVPCIRLLNFEICLKKKLFSFYS